MKIFHGGSVYSNKTRSLIQTNLLVRDGKILALSDDLPAEGEIVDCTGQWILPGLVDIHTHGRGGYDFNTASAEDCHALRRSYAMAGTTTVMATLASASEEAFDASFHAIGQNRTKEPGLAHIAGIHLEGRYLNPEKRGAHAAHLLHDLDPADLRPFLEKMLPLPVHISAAFELDESGDFLREALAAGATCGLAHSNATYEESRRAVERGVTSFTHTFNTMRPLHHREPGNAASSLLCDTAYTELICDGEHIHPEMIRMASRLKPADRVVLITDSMEAAGMCDGTYSIAGIPVYVKNGLAVNSEGALAGSTLDLFTALQNYRRFTGKTLCDALPCATSNPAAMVGISHLCGSIEAGKQADFLMISNENAPHPESVWILGERI